MNVTIAARHTELTDVLRDHAQEKGDWLANHFDFLGEMAVTIIQEDRRFTVEIIGHTRRGTKVLATAVGNDVLKTLDDAADKMMGQLRKLKERIKGHRVAGQPEVS
jgi:ribosomal subunit interface protein